MHCDASAHQQARAGFECVAILYYYIITQRLASLVYLFEMFSDKMAEQRVGWVVLFAVFV
jgi:hypothetical protein